MKKKIKYIIIFFIIILISIIISLVILKNSKEIKETNLTNNTNIGTEKEQNVLRTEENVLVIGIEQKNEIVEPEVKEEQPKTEPIKDASTLTQEIYDLNMEIGNLYIPKTGLKTQIYSNVTVNKMEKMPCFLYTTGGLSKNGVTLFVGHNRMNGKLFSNNDKLKVGDEFYFTDYEGTELKYKIYKVFTTTEDDVSFLESDMDTPIIALSCCTDANDENRIIVMGRVEK